jgi:hypothetical protein
MHRRRHRHRHHHNHRDNCHGHLTRLDECHCLADVHVVVVVVYCREEETHRLVEEAERMEPMDALVVDEWQKLLEGEVEVGSDDDRHLMTMTVVPSIVTTCCCCCCCCCKLKMMIIILVLNNTSNYVEILGCNQKAKVSCIQLHTISRGKQDTGTAVVC